MSDARGSDAPSGRRRAGGKKKREPAPAAAEPGPAAGQTGPAEGEPGPAAERTGQTAGQTGRTAGEPGASGDPGSTAGEPGTAAGESGTTAGQAGPTPGEPDALEQLQRAVLTAIGAARVVLDALEAVVADRRRIEQLSATGRDALGTLCALLGGKPAGDEPPPAGSDTAQDGTENS